MSRGLAAAATVALVASGLLTIPIPAAAADLTSCLADGHVWLHVEGVGSGCAAPGSGEDVIRSVLGGGAIQKAPNGIICRIAGYPSRNNCTYQNNGWHAARQEYLVYWHYYPCEKFPNGYAYRNVSVGCNEWNYSDEGAITYAAPAGSVEYWHYGVTQNVPVLKVPALAKPAPTTQPPRPQPPPATTTAPAATAPAPGTQAAPAPARTANGGTRTESKAAPGAGTQLPAPPDVSTATAPGATTTSGEAPASASVTSTPEVTAAIESTPAQGESTAPTAATGSASASATAMSAPEPDNSGAPAGSGGATSEHAAEGAGSPVGVLVTVGLVGLAAIGGGAWVLLRARRAK